MACTTWLIYIEGDVRIGQDSGLLDGGGVESSPVSPNSWKKSASLLCAPGRQSTGRRPTKIHETSHAFLGRQINWTVNDDLMEGSCRIPIHKETTMTLAILCIDWKLKENGASLRLPQLYWSPVFKPERRTFPSQSLSSFLLYWSMFSQPVPSQTAIPTRIYTALDKVE